MRNGLKALGAVLVIIALCAPLMMWPVDDAEPVAFGSEMVTVTVPPTVLVATTIPGLATTTTTTEPQSEPTPPTVSTSTTTTTAPIRVTVAAIGDVLAPESLLESVRDSAGSHQFGPVLAPIAPYLARADYTVAFLEPRLAGPKAGYGDDRKPNAPRELAFALQAAGVDLVATANTHSLDLGWAGVVGTLDRLDAAGLTHIGTSRSARERNTPVIADVGGIRVAFLNYTSAVAGRLPAGEKRDFAVNLLSLDAITQDAMTARSWGADAVVAMLNYGNEFEGEPGKEQVALSQEILDHGVDVILGSHARVVQQIGHRFTYASWRTNDKYVAYSLGDFLSASGTDPADSGIVAYLNLEKDGLRTNVTGVSYLPIYIQASPPTSSGEGAPVTYRVLPVMPGLEPDTDLPLTDRDRERMAQIWEQARSTLYRPDERITPLVRDDLIGY